MVYRATPLGKNPGKHPTGGGYLPSWTPQILEDSRIWRPGPPKSLRILAFEPTWAHLDDLARHEDAKQRQYDAKMARNDAKMLHITPRRYQKGLKIGVQSSKIH